MNYSKQHSSVPNQHQHSALQNTYATNLNFEPDATAFFEHRTLHQRHVIASSVGIGDFGVFVGESD